MRRTRLLACVPFLLAIAEPEAADLQLLESAVRSKASDVDLSTRRFQQFETGGGASAWFETYRKVDPDGAEWWKHLACSRGSISQAWNCSTLERKSIRVTPQASGTQLEVSIPLGLTGLAAHRFVGPGLQLIPQMVVSQACNPDESLAVQHLAVVKTAFARVEGNELSLSTERGGFALMIGPNAVHFEFDLSRDPGPRIRCWDDGDELE